MSAFDWTRNCIGLHYGPAADVPADPARFTLLFEILANRAVSKGRSATARSGLFVLLSRVDIVVKGRSIQYRGNGG